MSVELGYKTWSRNTYDRLILNGYEMTDCVSEIEQVYGPSGVQIPVLSGGSVYQRVPRSRNYPLAMVPSTFTIKVTSAKEEDYFRMNWLGALSRERPIHFWYGEMFEDVWPIRGTANLTWILSRQTYYGYVDYATYTPTAYIRSEDGTQVTQSFTISESQPSRMEIQHNGCAR